MPIFGPPDVEKLRSKRDVDGLIKALGHKNGDTRRDAARALGDIGDMRALDPLIAALQDQGWIEVRNEAARALGKLGDPRAIGPLVAALKVLFNDRWTIVTAGEALGEFGEDALGPLLEARADSEPIVRRYVAVALGKIGDGRALQPLVESALRDTDWSVSRDAAEALNAFGEAALEPLAAGLADSRAETRRRAVWALGRLRDPRANEAVTTARDDHDEDVRAAASLQLLPYTDKEMALKLKSRYRAAAVRWWRTSERPAAICDDRNEALRPGEGFLRPGYLACEACTDRTLARIEGPEEWKRAERAQKEWMDSHRELYPERWL